MRWVSAWKRAVGSGWPLALVLALLVGVTLAAEEAGRQARLIGHVETLASDDLEGRGAGYPGERAAAEYIARHFAELGLEPAGDSTPDGQSFFERFDFHPSGAVVPWQSLESRNVLALLPGSSAPHEVVVLGAHYDGQGRTGQADPGRDADETRPGDEIWNSADDNASSVAIVLEVARSLADRPRAPARSVLFVTFGAEEHGLVGSVHRVNRMMAADERPVAMVNLEKLGRMAGTPPVTASSGTSPAFATITERANAATGLEVVSIYDGIISDTDHYPFVARGIPAMVIGTLNEEDVHQPGDHAARIDPESLATRADYVEAFVLELAQRREPTPFAGDLTGWTGVQCSNVSEAELAAVGRPRDSGGAKVTALIDGLPGAEAGLRFGDLVLSIDGRAFGGLADPYPDLDAALAEVEGDRAELEILRDGERLSISIQIR